MAQSVGEVALDIVAGKNTLNSTIKSSMGEAQSTVSGGSSAISKALGGIGNVASAVGKTVVAGIGVASGAVASIGKSAISAYADYEQLVGGVETLYGASIQSAEEYAEKHGVSLEYATNVWEDYQARQQTVMDNASNAYKTAGMSANEYMETVNGFAASLNASLGEYEWQAGNYADMIVTDMADNANKMGTSLESIQNAYSGFAKQNYTMLDNLKLGYGGTKEEMQRLLSDAEELAGYSKGALDISSFADIADAIHIVQEELGITGTTAKEASGTISGSIATMKGAWQNLLTGMGDDTQDFGTLIDQFVSSVETVGENLLPRIEVVLGGVVKLVQGLAPKIIDKIPELISQLLPSIITASVSLVQAVVAIIPDLVNVIVEQLPVFIQGFVQIVGALIQALPTIIPDLIDAFTSTGAEMIGGLSEGLRERVPEFLANALPMLVDFTAELSNNIGLLVDAGLDLIVGLCEGIIDALPVLIANIPQIVINICSIINENAPKLAITAITLIGELILGIIRAIPDLIANIPKIIEAIVSVITAFNWVNLGGNIVKGITEGIKNLPANLKGFAKNAVENIKNAFSGGGIGKTVSSVFNGAKTSISDILNGALNIVKNIIKGIKEAFKFSWSLPHLALPHFSVSPAGWKIGDLLQGSIPKLSIDWYAKAMNNPMIMTKPTIFGYDAGAGKLLGGGEAGSELVVGTNTLLGMIKTAVSSVLGSSNMTIEVPALQNVKAGSSGSDSGLSDKMDRLIELFRQFIESGNADMSVPIYIGNELIDEYILGKNDRQRLRSGGRA